jgi:hypothetical protein
MVDLQSDLVRYRIAPPGVPLPAVVAPLYEYVLAGNGIFVRGARREFQAQFCVAPFDVRGLPLLEPSVNLNGPRVTPALINEMIQCARQAWDESGHPSEIVFHLELDERTGWQCHAPSQRQSPARTKPDDDSPASSYARACIEVHSHVEMDAFFSPLDDEDEQGFRIYAVLGCIFTTPVMRVRVGLYGYRQDIPAKWVFDLPDGIGDAVTGEGTLLGPLS